VKKANVNLIILAVFLLALFQCIKEEKEEELLTFESNPAGTWYSACIDYSYNDSTKNLYESGYETFTFSPETEDNKSGSINVQIEKFNSHNCMGTHLSPVEYIGSYSLTESISAEMLIDVNTMNDPVFVGNIKGHKLNITINTLIITMSSAEITELKTKFINTSLTWETNCANITNDTASIISENCYNDIIAAETNANIHYKAALIKPGTVLYDLAAEYEGAKLYLGYDEGKDISIEANRPVYFDERNVLFSEKPSGELNKFKGKWAGKCREKTINDGKVYVKTMITFYPGDLSYLAVEEITYNTVDCTGTVLGTMLSTGEYAFGEVINANSVTAENPLTILEDNTSGYKLNITLNDIFMTYSKRLLDDLNAKDTGSILQNNCGTINVNEQKLLTAECRTDLNTIDSSLNLHTGSSNESVIYTIAAIYIFDYTTLWLGHEEETIYDGKSSAGRHRYFDKRIGEEMVYQVTGN